MRKQFLSLLVISVLVVALLPFAFAAAHEGGPHLRVAHLSPTSPAVDVFVNGKKVIEKLAYKQVTDYLPLEGTTFEIVIVPAGGKIEDSVTPEPIKLTFAEGEAGYFTAAAVGSLADKTFEVVLLNDSAAHGVAAKDMPRGEARVGHIVITGAFARPTMKAGHGHGGHGQGHGSKSGVSAVYMKIENRGGGSDVLVSAETDVAGVVELHQTVIENDMAMMRPLPEGINLPPGSVTELLPGGLHIMLLDLKRELKEGDVITLTLVFKSGKRVTFDVPVRMP